MNEQIPVDARPTTPCDGPIGLGGPTLSTPMGRCGNTWGVPYGDEPSFAQCTRCQHTCCHNHLDRDDPTIQPFRFLTGPEIAARLITPETQLVLDRALDWRDGFVGSPEMPDRRARELLYAIDAYLATLSPPKPKADWAGLLIDDHNIVKITYTDGRDPVLIDVSDPHNPTIKEQ